MAPMNNRLLRPLASGSFDPRSIAGLAHWWDASDATTVTLDSGRVSNIADKVGGVNGANSASGSTQPDYVVGGRNGRNVMRFNPANSTELILSSAITSGTGDNLIFSCVAVMFRDNSAQTLQSLGFNAGVTQSYYHRLSTSSLIHQSSGGASTFTVAATTGGFICTVVRNAGSSVVQRVNGAERTDTTSAGVTNTTARNVTRIGRNSVAAFCDGDIGEILMWQRLLTADEVVAIERGLARKWGITL